MGVSVGAPKEVEEEGALVRVSGRVVANVEARQIFGMSYKRWEGLRCYRRVGLD